MFLCSYTVNYHKFSCSPRVLCWLLQVLWGLPCSVLSGSSGFSLVSPGSLCSLRVLSGFSVFSLCSLCVLSGFSSHVRPQTCTCT